MGNCINSNGHNHTYRGLPASTADPLLVNEDTTSVVVNDDLGSSPEYDPRQIQSLMSLTLSDNVEMQKTAAKGFLRMSKSSQQQVMSVILEALTNLLLSTHVEILGIASLAIGNFAIHGPAVNKSAIIHSGCLRPLVFLLRSKSLDIQCNACACVTALATTDANRNDILHKGAVRPLIDFARQADSKAHISASGALLNLSHSGQCRMELVESGAVPVMIDLLKSSDESVQYYVCAALSNIVVESGHRRLVMEYQNGVAADRLVVLMRSRNEKVQSQSCLAFRNIASEDRYQVQLVKCGGLLPLLTLVMSHSLEVSVAAVAALRNLSIHSANASNIVEAGFLPKLASLLDANFNSDLQYHVAGTLRNLAAENRVQSLLESGCLTQLASTMRDSSSVTERVLVECSVTLAAVAPSGDVQAALLTIFEGNFYKVVLHLMTSPVQDIQLNCGTILGCLLSKKELHKRLQSSSHLLSELLEQYINSNSQDLQKMSMWLVVQLHYADFPGYDGLLPSNFTSTFEQLKIRSDCSRSIKYETTLNTLESILK